MVSKELDLENYGLTICIKIQMILQVTISGKMQTQAASFLFGNFKSVCFLSLRVLQSTLLVHLEMLILYAISTYSFQLIR